MTRNIKKYIWYIAFLLNWAIIFVFWWQGTGGLLAFETQGSAFLAMGRLSGLAATYMILLQFFFMGRTPWLEKIFGLDHLSRMHRTNGLWGMLILLTHPILLTLGASLETGFSIWQQSKNFIAGYPEIFFAILGFVLFLIVIGTSIHIAKRKLRYESWYFVHLAAYLGIFFSFFHQIEIGTDLLASQFFYSYWILLYILVFSHHAIFRFIRPVYNYFKYQFYISEIIRENYNTISVYISGKNLQKFQIYPGQFMILRFFAKGIWWQAHPFSLSFVPDGKRLRVTIKELGDFTRQVANLKINTKILIDGPYGIFTEFFSVSPKILMIAGGIGITPIRSLFEQMTRHKKDVVLIYSTKTEKDIVFKAELNNIITGTKTKITHLVTDDPNYPGEKGTLDKEKIRQLVPDVANREIFLCGPPAMTTALIAILKELGVAQSHLHYEKFSLG